MKVNEKAWFKLSGKYLSTDDCEVEIEKSFYYKIELLEFINPKQRDPLNKEE